MAENVNGVDLFGSGGHVWLWGDRARNRKSLGTAGVVGEAQILVNLGRRPLTIAGVGRSPALLKATGVSRAAADAALTALERAIEACCDTGTVYTWEDPQGRTGAALTLHGYRRLGHREYSGDNLTVWQYYRVEGAELLGDL